VTPKRYRFIYSRQAEKFLQRNPSQVSQDDVEFNIAKAIRKITKEEDNNADIIPMKGAFKGNFRLRIGDVRVVFAYLEGDVRIVNIDTIDFRGNVYRIN
jgi:mRNA interferase RelE/StbE